VSGRGSDWPDFPPQDPACDVLQFNCTLADLDLALVAVATAGQTLSVGLLDERYPIALLGGERLGSITSGFARALADCLRKGEPFVCDVVKLEPGWVEVLVRHA
jgi:hypothetical protein